jgi:D-alanine-D-alanine ligase
MTSIACSDTTVMINEVNTLPGFTSISIHPRILAARGVGYSELMERLTAHAPNRADRLAAIDVGLQQ